ncbi:MAG TPA: c-type cytochrome biogenesis protein CcsB [Candidatus Binataceae bacterium]
MDTVWLLPALSFYALSSIGFIADRIRRNNQLSGYAVAMLAAGVIFHALDQVARGLQAGNIPVANFAQSLSFLAWLTALASLVLIVRLRLAVVGAFVAPSVLLALGSSLLATRNGSLAMPDTLRSFWLPIHVTLALLGEALFVIAACVSLVYLVNEARLKAKRPFGPSDESSPSLEKLDRINYRLLGWGLGALSLAIVSGAIWAEGTWGRFWSWEPRELWSLVTWILYATLLESRITVGLRGRRAAALTLVLFTVLVGSYLGVSLVYPGKHGGNFG